jgi:hypothetical protein
MGVRGHKVRKSIFETPSSLLAAIVASSILGFLGPGKAIADTTPSYATIPSYATQEQTIRGRIASINGQYGMTVRDVNGYLDNVQLHQGTVINPTGLKLVAGMSVTILGYNSGAAFQANEIDTPYTHGGPPPPYYGVAWSYPAFVFGYGYGWPRYYGPTWWNPGFYYRYGPRGYGYGFGYGYGSYRGYSVRQPWPSRWPT